MISKITLIGTLPPIKGISDYCIQQISGLSKIIKVNFIGFNKLYPEFLYPGGTKEINSVFKFDANSNVKINQFLSWKNPLTWIKAGLISKGDIVHFHWWTYVLFPIFFTIAIIAKARGKKIVCTVHNVLGHETNFFDKFFSSILFLVVDMFSVHTKSNLSDLHRVYKIDKSKIRILPHGIYDFYSDKKMSKNEARKKLVLPLNSKVILFFGNIREYKGVTNLIESFNLASKEISSLFLVIAGKPWNNDFAEELKKSVSKIKNKKLVFDYIPSSDIKYYFESADVVVLPYREFSAQSGPGNIALAFEKPLIVSNVGGLSELVLDKKVIFPAKDSVALASKIKLVFSEKGLLEKLSLDSKILKKQLSWENISKKTIAVYNELL